MAEYINRDDLLKAAWDKPTLSISVYDIGNINPVDVAPVRHARWDENGRCTNCGGHAPFWCMASTYYESPWCHECGCKMDLEY